MKKQLLFYSILLISFFLFYSCLINPYTKYYNPYLTNVILPNMTNHEPVFYGINNYDEIYDILNKGYEIFGESAFTEENYNYEDSRLEAIEQSKIVGAEILVYYAKYLGSETKDETRIKYVPGEKTVRTKKINVWSDSGYATESSTEVEKKEDKYEIYKQPVDYSKYEYHAYYLRKINVEDMKFGFLYAPINKTLQKELDRNFAVVLLCVYENSKMYMADIMQGDIILEVNGIKLNNKKQFENLLEEATGNITFTIYRNGKIITKKVAF